MNRYASSQHGQSAAQSRDERIENIRLSDALGKPVDFFDQNTTRRSAMQIAQQGFQQRQFQPMQYDRRAVHKGGACCGIERQGAADDRRRALAARSAQARANARHQLIGVEGFGQVIVSAGVETLNFIADRTIGRKRTAVRAAGFALISATAGMRIIAISTDRVPGTSPSALWKADVQIEGEIDQDRSANAQSFAAEEIAIRLMRALAPRIAEELVFGSATPGADKNNFEATSILADFYMQKTGGVLALNEDENSRIKAGILEEFERTVLLRLAYFHTELKAIMSDLMKATFLNQRKCDSALQRIYVGFRDFSDGTKKSQLFRLTRKAEE